MPTETKVDQGSYRNCVRCHRLQTTFHDFVYSVMDSDGLRTIDWAGASFTIGYLSLFAATFLLLLIGGADQIFSIGYATNIFRLSQHSIWINYMFVPALIAGTVTLTLQCSIWWWGRVLRKTYDANALPRRELMPHEVLIESLLVWVVFLIPITCFRIIPSSFWWHMGTLQAVEIFIFSWFGVYLLAAILGKEVDTSERCPDHKDY